MARKKQQRSRLLPLRATAVVVDPSSSRILLVKHNNSNEWALPGGRPTAVEEPGQRAALAVAEETGIIIGEPVFAGRYAGNVSAHQIFVATGLGHPRVNTRRIQDATWWDLETPLRLQSHVSAVLAIVRQELRGLSASGGHGGDQAIVAASNLPVPVNGS